MRLSEMTVAITGAGSGIGLALADGFLADGARVLAADLNELGLAALTERGALALRTDVADPTAVDAMIQKAVDWSGRLDVLINNAGIAFRADIDAHAPDQFETLIRVNLLGPYHGMRAAVPLMRRQNFGRIINLLSRQAEAAAKGFAAYAAAKAGLWALSRTAAAENTAYDIKINGLIPGPTRSGMNPNALQDPRVVYPTARMLAALPADGPTGRVFWNLREYRLFDTANEAYRP
jgi:NAD(P)-dependent dehydrogenase (short-subunit alcohol dehydrogenase family)